MLELLELDRPKSFGEKIAEFIAIPPKPIMRFYGPFSTEASNSRRNLIFAVRNGLPLPLLYGIYANISHDSFSEYIERVDHIGPFSIDNWRLTFDAAEQAQVEIRVGLVPWEILTDRVSIVV